MQHTVSISKKERGIKNSVGKCENSFEYIKL